MTGRTPQIGDRVLWACKPGTTLAGKVVALEGACGYGGTMMVVWDGGTIARHLPQRVMEEPRWSYER
jgi:hypothetical protein